MAIYIAVDTGEPALFEILGVDLTGRFLPYRRRERLSMFVECECLKGILDVWRYRCIYERVFFGVMLKDSNIWYSQRT